jgi:CRISPR-associated protein Csx17
VTVATNDVVLGGCRPEPLGSYLKALGVLRLVAEQEDPDARGFWRGEHFVLRSKLDGAGLVQFFRDRWAPTPVIAPWNGGSGFYPKDNREAAEAILASESARLGAIARSIRIARDYIAARGWTERPADEDKATMISAMRAVLPDEALAWLDAAVVLGDARPLFPPLLGTGGNDGRLDFSNNFQQRVVEVMKEAVPLALESSLFGVITTSRFKGAMGQYLPSAHERTNPWDFVLLIEGAMVFAAAVTRRLESSSPATLAFPFHAHASGGLATVVDSDENESRNELWLPIWRSPATFRSIRRLFAEGRTTVGSGEHARPAATALDFARSVSALGVDRGIDAFSRIGFHVRNGLAYFATPLGRFATGEVRSARLLDDIDAWFERFRSRTSGKNVPARVALARRRLEQAMFEAAAGGGLGPVLLELGDAELALTRSLGFTKKAFLQPIPPLSAAWADEVRDGSIEQRLAAALAARRQMRSRVVPLESNGRVFGRADESSFVFGDRPLIDNLHALLLREDIEWQQGAAKVLGPADREGCSLSDVASFIAGEVDDAMIERWLRGLLLLEGGFKSSPSPARLLPPAAYAALALVQRRSANGIEVPRTAGALARASAGDSIGATQLAIRRLNASKRPFPTTAIFEPALRMRRIAAALAFPLTETQYRRLEQQLALPSLVSSASDTQDPAQEQP